MKNILLVSIACPPKSDPESIQVARYIKYLSQIKDLRLDIVSSKDPTLYMETDPYLEKYLTYSNTIDRYMIFENRYINALIRKINPEWLQYPDSKFTFKWVRHNKEKPDLIYSRSYPVSSSFLAYKLWKKYQVPWILHLSDPWAISHEGDSPATNYLPAPRKWNKKKERVFFEAADLISLTSIKTLNLYRNAYPDLEKKFIITPNVYDDENTNTQAPSFHEKLKIVYTGGFGEKRSPEFFLKTITDWLLTNDAAKVEFLFSGPMTRENKELFSRYENAHIRHLGMIGYQEMLALQFSAHILVNIDTDIADPKHAVFFPSKLLEYFAANRRLLAITNPYSNTADIVNEGLGDVVNFIDRNGLTMLLDRYHERFKMNDSQFFELESLPNKYAASENALLLKQYFDKTLSKYQG